MATPLFDDVSIEFAKAIGDYIASMTAATEGNKLTAAERNGIVNKALSELFRQTWQQVGGNAEAFIEIFPELLVERQITTSAGGTYTVANPNLDFNKIVDARKNTGSVFITALPKTLRQIVITSKHPHYVPSAAKPYVFEISKVLEFYPASEYNAQTVYISFIKVPVDPTTGAVLTQGGSYDSPFYAHWHRAIVEIAKQIYLDMSQQKG